LDLSLDESKTEEFDLTRVLEAMMKVLQLINKVHTYWLAKTDKELQESIKPLFNNLDEPSYWQVGALMELNSGHTKEFNTREELRLNTHLMACSFGDAETSNFLHDLTIDE